MRVVLFKDVRQWHTFWHNEIEWLKVPPTMLTLNVFCNAAQISNMNIIEWFDDNDEVQIL